MSTQQYFGQEVAGWSAVILKVNRRCGGFQVAGFFVKGLEDVEVVLIFVSERLISSLCSSRNMLRVMLYRIMHLR
jgi:hypothetical protein